MPNASETPDRLRDEFVRACKARDPAALRHLLEREPSAVKWIDEPLFAFDSPALVHFSADNAMVEVLLTLGADPNRRSAWWAGGFHALHSARGAAADRLIAAGAVPDACAAANLDRPKLLRRLLDEDPSRVHERGGDGQTPLHFARSREVVDLLLEQGADPNARDVDHRATPAQWMLERRRDAGRYDLASYLVERGASADVFLAAALGLTTRLRDLVDADPSVLRLRTAQGEYGEQPPSSYHIYFWSIGPNLSPLRVAAQFGQEEALALLRALADAKERFLAACATADAEEAKGLLRVRPALIAELTDADMRVLPDAAESGDAAAVELMLELGLDPAAAGRHGGTVLHWAAWEGSQAVVEAVLRRPRGKALIHRRDTVYGATPLGWCCHGASHAGRGRDHAAVARLLLDAGAKPGPDTENAPAEVLAIIRTLEAGPG